VGSFDADCVQRPVSQALYHRPELLFIRPGDLHPQAFLLSPSPDPTLSPRWSGCGGIAGSARGAVSGRPGFRGFMACSAPDSMLTIFGGTDYSRGRLPDHRALFLDGKSALWLPGG